MSYSRCAADVARWVVKVLEPMLRERLPHHGVMGDLAVFRDERSIATGEDWPDELQRALCGADVLVPVFTPEYFRRPWCQAEFWTMYDRRQRLGLRCIQPLRYSDGVHFPEEACRMEWVDVKEHYMVRSHLQAPVLLHKRIDELCGRIAQQVRSEPPVDPDWRFVPPPIGSTGLLSKPQYGGGRP
jgi:TIR domain